MKLRLSILLLAAALAASPAAGQTIKSLGYNTTNGVVPTSLSTNTLRFTNAEGLQFNKLTTENMVLGTNGVMTFYSTNSGFGFSAGATAAQFCDDLGLGTTNAVTFGTLAAGQLQVTSGTNLYVNLADDVSEFFVPLQLEDELAVVGAATFSTNVTVNGNLSVGSFTTTTPSTWALDATQTAAATNGVLDLPSNANVIRLTNNNAISGVSGGVLGAFYYLVNQTTNAVTISNVGGITVQGGTPLTLGANQAATLVATGATNASVAARGDLTDVALGGTANTAPSQTASSGSSLMTRALTDNNSLFNIGSVRPLGAYAFAGANGGGGQAAYGFGTAIAYANTNTNSYGIARLYYGLNVNAGFMGAFIQMSQTISVAATLGFNQIFSNGVVRLTVGNPTTPALAASNALSTKGFGVEFARSATTSDIRARLFAHDGTSYTNSAYTSDFSIGGGNRQIAVLVSKTAAGAISLHLGLPSSGNLAPPRISATPSVSLNFPIAGSSDGPWIDLVAHSGNTNNAGDTVVIYYNGMVEVKD